MRERDLARIQRWPLFRARLRLRVQAWHRARQFYFSKRRQSTALIREMINQGQIYRA